MSWNFTFAPLLPQAYLIGFGLIIALLTLFMAWRGMRGAWMRILAGFFIVIAMANPSLLQEDREKLKTVVALIVDDSESQALGARKQQTELARSALAERISHFDDYELREVVVKNQGVNEDGEGSTELFKALRQTFRDVPPERIGGAVLLTDGRVHDVPLNEEALSFGAPLHALISGSEDERDRRIEITSAPRFGIIDTRQSLNFKVLDHGSDIKEESVDVEIYIDGDLFTVERVISNQDNTIDFDVPHAGKIIIELRVNTLEDEITTTNNQTFWVMDGIRENLRVLLVSGDPNSGERAWRNLLKSDASVDLVHFTILRPPNKQDGTPINQLSLIAFPTRELFVEKIDDFDLIIFDRYQRRGVLPILYFDNIARYVEQGGAVLLAAGPEFAGDGSIYNTPLSSVLPTAPNGNVIEGPYRPKISQNGQKHPVTRSLNEALINDSNWGRWLRQIDNDGVQGETLMEGNSGKPLLVLGREGEGRVATILSDNVWLWARNFDGGGPYVQLLRRLSHWLMKEPELEEEALKTSVKGSRLIIQRQTMSDEPDVVQVISPMGKIDSVELEEIGAGTWQGNLEAPSLGLYQLASGDLRALAHVGPTNPLEFQNVISTDEVLKPLFETKGGFLGRINERQPAQVPRIVPISNNRVTSGKDWLGFKPTNATVLKGISQLPIFAGLLGLVLLLFGFVAMWFREGR